MKRLYIFAIGGTGARVLKALTMLMVGGVDTKNFEIVPILIDPHSGNSDLSRTETLLEAYKSVRGSFNPDYNEGFFKSRIDNVDANFFHHLPDIDNNQFDNYIEYAALSQNNKDLVDLVYSAEVKRTRMDIGFQGRPNIGVVVLNTITTTDFFKTFANDFNQTKNNRIFIVGSIFGGTGSAGIPTLINKLRNLDTTTPNSDLIKNTPIAAIPVQPYFSVDPDENSSIKSGDFILKTKAALTYYNDHFRDKINITYYIGNKNSISFQNDSGARGQQNKAHFVELASALAILDFIDTDEADLQTQGAKVLRPIYKKFGIENEAEEGQDTINLKQLDSGTEEKLARPIIRLAYTAYYMKQLFKTHLSKPERWAQKIGVNKSFINTDPYKKFKIICDGFLDWIKEMQVTKSFYPFNLFRDDEFIKNEKILDIVRLESSKPRWESSPRHNTLLKYINVNIQKPEKKEFKMEAFVKAVYKMADTIIDKYFKSL